MWLSPLSSPNGVWRVPNMLPTHVASPTFASYLIVHIGAAFIFSCIQIRLIRCSWWNQYAHPLPFQIGSESRGGFCLSWRNNKDGKEIISLFYNKKNNCFYFSFFKFTNIPLDSNQDWKKLDSEFERTFQQSPMEGKYFNIWLVFHNQLSSNCSCLDRPCPDPREKSHAQNNHLHNLKNQRWNSPRVVLIYLSVTDPDPFQIISKQ